MSEFHEMPTTTVEQIVRFRKAALDEIDRLRAELAEKNSWMTLGVGDGSGKLFVHGDFESIHACREKLFELEKLRAELLAAEKKGMMKAAGTASYMGNRIIADAIEEEANKLGGS